jgi:hypothetical protein
MTYYDLVVAAFVCVPLCANLVGVSKAVQIGGFTFGAGSIFFPLSYLFSDVPFGSSDHSLETNPRSGSHGPVSEKS